MIRLADRVIEIGPGAGVGGGTVTFEGTPDEMLADENSLTGQFLSGNRGWSLERSHAANAAWAHHARQGLAVTIFNPSMQPFRSAP